MAENLRDVIAKIKASQQISQQPKAAPALPPLPPMEEIEEVIKEELHISEPKVQQVQKPVVVQQERPQEQPTLAQVEEIVKEIEMLQNNGRFRAEMLQQLNGIRESLNAIAEILVYFAKNEK